MYTRTVSFGAFLTAVGIILGAFGAHALKGTLSEYGAEIFKTASLYHLLHGVAIVTLATLGAAGLVPHKVVRRVVALFVLGLFIFSGSLYLLAITEVRWLGAITPIGGLSFIVGWLILGLSTLKSANSSSRIDNPSSQG